MLKYILIFCIFSNTFCSRFLENFHILIFFSKFFIFFTILNSLMIKFLVFKKFFNKAVFSLFRMMISMLISTVSGGSFTRICSTIPVDVQTVVQNTEDVYTITSLLSANVADDNAIAAADTTLELIYEENLGYVLMEDFWIPIEILVFLEIYNGGSVDGGEIQGKFTFFSK